MSELANKVERLVQKKGSIGREIQIEHKLRHTKPGLMLVMLTLQLIQKHTQLYIISGTKYTTESDDP